MWVDIASIVFVCVTNLPTFNVKQFFQSVVYSTETATANRTVSLELTATDAQQVANFLDVVSGKEFAESYTIAWVVSTSFDV